jgi:hypothetical protein
MISLFAGVVMWKLGRPHVWILDVALVAIFGPDAAGLGGFVALIFLIAIVRAVSRIAGAGLGGWFRRLLPGRPADSLDLT